MSTSKATEKASINTEKQFLLRFRNRESATGITHEMLLELAEYLGVTATAAIHMAVGRMYLQILGDRNDKSAQNVRFADARSPTDVERLGEFVGVDLRPGKTNKPGITTIGDVIEKHKKDRKTATSTTTKKVSRR